MLAKSVAKWIACHIPPSPRMIGSRGTQTKFVCRIVKSLCAKFRAFFHSVTILSLNHLTKQRASLLLASYRATVPRDLSKSLLESAGNYCRSEAE